MPHLCYRGSELERTGNSPGIVEAAGDLEKSGFSIVMRNEV